MRSGLNEYKYFWPSAVGGGRSLAAAAGAYLGALAVLAGMAGAALQHATQTAVSILPQSAEVQPLSRVRSVELKNQVNLQKVSQRKAEQTYVPTSFAPRSEPVGANRQVAAVLPEPTKVELARQLSVFLGGTSEHVDEVKVVSVPRPAAASGYIATSVAGFYADCGEACSAPVTIHAVPAPGALHALAPHKEIAIAAVPAAGATEQIERSNSQLVTANLDDDANSKAIAKLAALKSPKRIAKPVRKNDVALERPKKGITSTVPYIAFLVPEPAKKKKKALQVAEIDLFTTYFIGQR